MYTGKLVFSQGMEHLPVHEFQKCVARYGGDYKSRGFSCRDRFLCMSFAQLTFRESLRDIEACLRSVLEKLYHLGFRGYIARSTLADAKETRDWRIYADFAQSLIHIAGPMYASDPLGVDLDATVYALDSTTIDLCLSVFPWAHFRQQKAAVKMHTLLDLRGSIPTFIEEVSDGKHHDVHLLDEIVAEPGAFYVMDRAYLDFKRHAHQNRCCSEPPILPCRASGHRRLVGSNGSSRNRRFCQELSRYAPPRPLCRSRASPFAYLLNQ